MNDGSIQLYRGLLLATDILAGALSFCLVLWLLTGSFVLPGGDMASVGAVLLAAIAMVGGIWSMRGYAVERIFRIMEEAAIVLLGSVVGSGIFACFLFFTGALVPRSAVLILALVNPLLSLAFRTAWRKFFTWSNLPRIPTARVLIVGHGELGRQVGRQLQERAWLGLELVGYVDEREIENVTLEALHDLKQLCMREQVDVLILTLPMEQQGHLLSLVEHINELPVQIKLLPDLYPLAYFHNRIEMFGGIPLLSVAEPVLTPWEAAVKRAMDIVLSAILLLLFAPLMLFIAVGIRLTSRGPVIFEQERVGEGGRLFRMYKFRTMVVGAEEMLQNDLEDDEALLVKRADDPRVTPFGRWLRRFSLDELPNFWNVFRGDMSLVGPRPEMPYIVERYEPWQRKRLLVPQGITGWWQINGRSDKPMLYHTEDDLYYIRNFSLLLDIEIMWKTIWVVVRGKGAY